MTFRERVKAAYDAAVEKHPDADVWVECSWHYVDELRSLNPVDSEVEGRYAGVVVKYETEVTP